MDYKFTVNEEDLKNFLRSLISHSYRAAVKSILSSASLNWKTYWNIPVDARKSFIEAALWAEMYPTTKQLKEIFLKEKRKGSVNLLLNGYDYKWWISREPLETKIKESFNLLTIEEFQSINKKLNIINIIKYASKEQLPLLIGDKRLIHSDANSELEKRLK